MSEKEALRQACKEAGSQMALAEALGLKSQGTIQNWLAQGRAPAERVLDIERATGVPRYKLRPDIYPPDEYRAA